MTKSQSEEKTVTIIGLGALGTALARAVRQLRLFEVDGLYNRTERKAKELADELEVDWWGGFPSGDELGDVVMLALSDDVIEAKAEQLADLIADWSGKVVFHHSGTLTSFRLDALRQRGAAVAALHPLQTFNQNSGPDDFCDIYFNVEGDDAAVTVAETLAESLGSRIVHVSKEAKPRLHASAVVACNYLVSLLDASGRITEEAGLDRQQTLEMLMPLIRKTLDNIEKVGTREALSGPAVRGDVGTIQHHMNLLEGDPELLDLYRMMGRYTTNMALESGRLDEDRAKELLKVFGKNE